MCRFLINTYLPLEFRHLEDNDNYLYGNEKIGGVLNFIRDHQCNNICTQLRLDPLSRLGMHDSIETRRAHTAEHEYDLDFEYF